MEARFDPLQVITLVCLLAAYCVSAASSAPIAAPTENLALDISAWSANQDGGCAPSIAPESSIQITGKPAMRLVYRDQTPHYGNAQRAITIPATTRAVSIRLYKHAASKNAEMFVWLLEPDGDGWSQRILIDDKPLSGTSNGWQDVEAPVGQFVFDPRGDRKPQISKCTKMLIGFTNADSDVSIADVRCVLSGESPRESPAVLPPPTPEKGEKGRIAILSENFVKRKAVTDKGIVPENLETPELTEEDKLGSPSASDPAYLGELATRAGYGVTMLSASALTSPGYLSPNNFDLLVIPSAPYYPLDGTNAIQTFLASGGSLFTTGGYAFDKPCIRAGEAWQTVRQSLTVEDLDAGRRSVGLNHRFGIPDDGQGPQPGQIPLFDPMNPLRGAAYGEPLVSWIPKTKIDGPFEGWAASALLGSNDPVFPKAYARWVPLLMGYDSIGRKQGTLGSIVHNFDGPYKGSSWAAFGVTNADLFSRTGALAIEFPDIIDRIVHKVYLRSLKTDLFLYKPGEPVKLSVVCSNFDKSPAKAVLRFEITTRNGIPVSLIDPVEREVPAGFEERVEIVWDLPPAMSDDYYRVRCRMSAASNEDEMETAFCLDNPKMRASGFKLSLKDNYLQGADKPGFWLGTNQTGAIFVSEFEDPMVWDKDLSAMRSNGLNIMRVLHFSPFVVADSYKPQPSPLELPADKLPRALERKLDALVQLSANHNIVLFLTLHDWMGVDLTDQELEAQKRFAQLIAARYAQSPHVMYDVQNEPTVKLTRDKENTELWNRFLTEKYKTQEALASAWGVYLNGEKLGAVKLDPGKSEWANMRFTDRDWYRCWLFDRWMAANLGGVKVGSRALGTVGYIQFPNAADQLLGNQHSDFTNKHYYGDKAKFPHEIKLIDRRFEGKGLSLGEFGSIVDHHARIAGQTTDVADSDWFIEAAGCVMGQGGMFALNWCWKEMPDNVFPWGINTPNDNIPRDTLLGFRAFALATRGFQPKYIQPDVFICAPDNIRQGAGQADANLAVFRAIDGLIAQNVPFGVINEGSLSKLPPSIKLVILPLPVSFSDEGYTALRTYVQNGGVLLATGDISFDVHRKRSKTDRLKDLFGVEFVKELEPPMTGAKDAAGVLTASIEVKAAGATEISPQVWLNTVGKGCALFTPVPWELEQEPVGLYARAFTQAKITASALQPATPQLILYTVPGVGQGDQFFFLHNRTGDSQDVTLPVNVRLTLKKDEKALVVAKGGKPTSLMASGKVMVEGKPWADFAVPTVVASLDGKPLTESVQIALCPMGTGAVQIRSLPGVDAVAWVGEVDETRWMGLAQRPIQKVGDMLIVPAETALRFGLITLSSNEGSSAAGKALAASLAEP